MTSDLEFTPCGALIQSVKCILQFIMTTIPDRRQPLLTHSTVEEKQPGHQM